MKLPRIHTCLWFEHQAEEAARFYVSVFPRSRVTQVTRYPAGGHMPEGTVLTVGFELDGVPLMALNGSASFPHSPAMSLVVTCDSQQEVDEYWGRLSAVPEKEQCGWLVDRFGVSWQIVPAELMDMVRHKDAHRRKRVFDALMPMRKLDIAALRRAFDLA